MNTTLSERYANIAAHAGPSPIGGWLKATLLRLVAARPATPRPRDPAREAAEVRSWAADVQRTDPRFAAELFAAADRHEAKGL